MTEQEISQMNPECRNVRLELACEPPDSELSAETQRHLATCEACRRERADHDRVWELLDSLEAPPAPESLLAAVEQRVRRPADELALARAARRRTEARHRPSRWFSAAAAAMVLFGIGTGVWLGSQDAGAARASHTRASASAPNALDDHAEFFTVDPPGSLTRAYASLERSEVEP